MTIAIENLAPLYPGPETLSATPAHAPRPGAADRLAGGRALPRPRPRPRLADLRHTTVELLCEPVLDRSAVFHLHDNLGARRRTAGDELGVDPLRLDLHLPPGRGTLPWERVAPLLAAHGAPLLLEVHPPFRPRAERARRRPGPSVLA